MIWQGVVEIEPQVPQGTQPASGQPQQLAFGAKALEGHHELEHEEEPQINAWSPKTGRVAVLHYSNIQKGETGR
jgi:hypothetical protein